MAVVFSGVGMFLLGAGFMALTFEAPKIGAPFVIVGVILELPAFYLVYKHKES